MSRELISNRRLAGSCFKMALTDSIRVEICDETMVKMWRKPSLVPRPARAIRVTRGGLEPSAIARAF